MRNVMFVLSSLLLGGAIVVSVGADDKNKATSDTDFVTRAMACGMDEVTISEYAAKNASDEKVKDFAQRLAREHKELNNVLGDNAKRLKVAIISGVEKDARARMEKLSKLKGNEFDVEFLQQTIDGHENAIALFESESKNGGDAEVKTIAKDNLPTLKRHLTEAREHQARLKK